MIRPIALALLATVMAAPASAQKLTLAAKAELLSLDPHFHNGPQGHQIYGHMFDRLARYNSLGAVEAGLAESWTYETDKTLVFKLRPNARFHDGTPVTAADVIASIERIPGINNGGGPFLPYVRTIVKTEARDPLTVVMHTRDPSPNLPSSMALVSILAASQKDVASDAFNTGPVIGSGPFKVVRYNKGQSLELVRNDQYWGPKPDWAEVSIRFIPNDASRLAALLSGDVDFIGNVGTQDAEDLKTNAKVSVFQAPSFRVVHLSMDQKRDVTNHLKDVNGQPLTENPLRKLKVRQALAATIDRQVILDRVMGGFGAVTAQLGSPETFAYDPEIKVTPPDIARAKTLLTEAGYPNGFQLTVHTPSDFIPAGPQIAQVIAQGFARAGLKVTVQAVPSSVFFVSTRKPEGSEWSVWLTSWGNTGGDTSAALQQLLHTADRAKQAGAQNVTGISLAQADALIDQALVQVDPEKRRPLQQQAMRLLMADAAEVPLFAQAAIFAGRKGLTYVANPQDYLLAYEVKAAK